MRKDLQSLQTIEIDGVFFYVEKVRYSRKISSKIDIVSLFSSPLMDGDFIHVFTENDGWQKVEMHNRILRNEEDKMINYGKIIGKIQCTESEWFDAFTCVLHPYDYKAKQWRDKHYPYKKWKNDSSEYMESISKQEQSL